MSTRSERMRWVEADRRRIELDELSSNLSSASARKRVVEILSDEAGLPAPQWKRHGVGGDAAALAGDSRRSPLDVEARFAAEGLRVDHHGKVRCDACKEVLVAIPTGRPFGLTPTALRVWHESMGCR